MCMAFTQDMKKGVYRFFYKNDKTANEQGVHIRFKPGKDIILTITPDGINK